MADELTPKTRMESILSGEELTPETRIEGLLLGEEIVPKTRMEMYYAAMGGQSVELPEPKTRLELFCAKAAGMSVETPEPETRIEMFLSEWSGGGVELTVSGNAPVTLANAIAHAIVSLTQEGKVTQASTPTPSAPKDIVCNNGALKMVDDELPTGYKRVLGFTCDNNAMWQITGFNLKGSDTVRISFSVEAACNVWGCYQGTDANDNYDLYASVSAGSKYLRYGNGTYLSYFSAENLGQRFDVVVTPTGTSGMPQDSTWTPKTFTSANDLLIGSTTVGGTSSKLKGNLYGNIIVDGRLKLIPCERVSDNVFGYYDTYSETFYEPYEGYDGAVSLGYDGSHYSLATVGTPEVLSIGTQTASVADLYAVGDYKDTQEIIGGTVNRAVGVAVIDGTETVTVENKCYVLTLADKVSAKTQMYCSHFAYANSNTSTVADGKMVTYSPAKVGFRYDALHPGSETIIAEKTITGNETDTIPLSAQEIAAIQTLNNGDTVVITVDGVAKTVTALVDDDGGGYKFWEITDNYETVDIQANSENAGDIMLCASGTFTIKLEAPTPMVGSQFADFAAAQYNAGTPIVVVYPLATATTEQVAPQTLTTAEGTNTVSVTSNVDPVKLTVVYKGTEEGGD